ncbi:MULTISPECIES: ATP-grasp domain-containing protein [unclassified Streptomyces]|uniref:ATP-grasp domain-containing protein n=1 Tax=unclassified Streptomyces TaxID=2593676 RepID=UPI0022B6FDC0|nr:MULTISPECIES: ATP-grasp domain-containing protein [unclassified Streptomyces]MCZ7413976.1 ATP-grasp domain-containing protein [Streptomyces sp. WMMC897]MCZ7430972.1 ATP-grasp domain-containing protein [Streptomyces sp. WMMC1477]
MVGDPDREAGEPMAPHPPLLLLGGALKPTGLDCMDQAAERGVDVVVADTADNLRRAPEVVERALYTVELTYSDPEEVRAWATAAAAEGERYLGVYGTRETAAESVAVAAEVLGLPGNGQQAVRRIQDKYACRAALATAGFPQPPSARCHSAQALRSFLAEHPKGPWIVKPAAGRGSAGVSLVRDATELDAALDHLIAAHRELTADLHRQGVAVESPDAFEAGVLVEGFQEGEEFSAEGVFVDGVPRVLALTAKVTTGGPHFVELGHSMPAPVAPGIAEHAQETLAAAAKALGLSWGVFHIEFWLTVDGRIVLGEFHVRPGGDSIYVMAQRITGVGMHGVVFDQLLGNPVDAGSWRPRHAAAIRFLTPPPGTVADVEGWAEAASAPEFLSGKLTLEPGSEVPPLKSSFDRTSFVCARGDTAAEAVANADRLVRAVRISLRPTPTPG